MEKNLKLSSKQNFLRTIFVGQARGQGIIEICDKLAGGDKFKSLRLIAKFKTLLASDKQEVLFVINQLKDEGIVIENPYEIEGEVKNKVINSNNIVPFPMQATTISETELNSLFLGLCKLVKRFASEEASFFYKKKQNEVEQKLRRQIENLQLLNEGLAMENKRLMEKVDGSTLQKI